MNVMMKCGHSANAQDSNGNPVCVICVGISEGATEVDVNPNLTGRVARCGYFNRCHTEQPSDVSLPFFEHHPNKEHDSFYCGCFGWD